MEIDFEEILRALAGTHVYVSGPGWVGIEGKLVRDGSGWSVTNTSQYWCHPFNANEVYRIEILHQAFIYLGAR